MRKPGTKQLLVEIPIELADALDEYCDKHGRLKGWLVRNAIETFLKHEERSTSRFIVDLEDATADKLEAFRKVRDHAHPADVAVSAIQHYMKFILANEPTTKELYDALEAKVREARTRSNLSVLDGGQR